METIKEHEWLEKTVRWLKRTRYDSNSSDPNETNHKTPDYNKDTRVVNLILLTDMLMPYMCRDPRAGLDWHLGSPEQSIRALFICAIAKQAFLHRTQGHADLEQSDLFLMKNVTSSLRGEK